jgi:DNA (cytosine-5)-methyltransferase 1
MSLGLESAGLEVILGVDFDEHAIATHRAHFGGCSLQADLSDPAEIDRVTVARHGTPVDHIAASPAGPPFSRAGLSKSAPLLGKRESLTRRNVNAGGVSWLRWNESPRAVLFENILGITQGDEMLVAAQLLERLEDLGLDTYVRVLLAKFYGVPQHRERVFVV